MDLNFLGRGNSSNYLEGNTSAYFIENNELFLIDCGESVFSKLLENDLLEDISKVHVMITHTHSDHIGSLGSLIMYCFFNKHIKINIILPANAKHWNNIITILKAIGCDGMYNINYEDEYDDRFQTFDVIEYVETKHVDYLACYSIIFYTHEGIIYYSGDSNNLDIVLNLLKDNVKISKMYIDVTSTNSKDNIHLYIGKLIEKIPSNLKEKVYCMHFNNQKCIDEARSNGFHVVKKK